jgi:hypothetical protein
MAFTETASSSPDEAFTAEQYSTTKSLLWSSAGSTEGTTEMVAASLKPTPMHTERGHFISGSILTDNDEGQAVAFPLDKAVFRTRYILVCVLISVVLAIVFFLCKRKTTQRPWKRRLMPDGFPAKRPRLEILEKIYAPIQGDARDDDYENTFVGVSVPLLQDITPL